MPFTQNFNTQAVTGAGVSTRYNCVTMDELDVFCWNISGGAITVTIRGFGPTAGSILILANVVPIPNGAVKVFHFSRRNQISSMTPDAVAGAVALNNPLFDIIDVAPTANCLIQATCIRNSRG